jgi:hypothetical protein
MLDTVQVAPDIGNKWSKRMQPVFFSAIVPIQDTALTTAPVRVADFIEFLLLLVPRVKQDTIVTRHQRLSQRHP